MKAIKIVWILVFMLNVTCSFGQSLNIVSEENLLRKIMEDPTPGEIEDILNEHRINDLSPREIVIHDTVLLSNSNLLYILSHKVDSLKHFGAVIIPENRNIKKLPVIIFATGGDGMHKEFDISQDFNHGAIQYPDFLGGSFDQEFIVVIPGFRGQELIVDNSRYLCEGNVSDAFDGATTDALAFLNIVLETFEEADENRIAIYGGSRGGTVALLASARDSRIKRTIAVAAPTDMKALYQLYPDQFKLLFFNDLISGKISESDARKKFISMSPIYFASELSMVQLHHDQNDPFVPAEFAQQMSTRMRNAGKDVELYLYDEGIHGFWMDKAYWDRVLEFISPLTD